MNPIEPELMMRYLSGDVTTAERERVEAWLAEDPDRWTQLLAAREKVAQDALSEPAMEQVKSEVWARLRQAVPEIRSLGLTKRRRMRSRDVLATLPQRPRAARRSLVAAAILALVGASAAGWFLLLNRPQPVARAEVVGTAPGERAKLRLPDGTAVMLNAASTLHYDIPFGQASREVMLVGEAYFEVTHDATRPFVVHAGDLIAKDLGTEFTVRAYGDANPSVAVRKGRVALRGVGELPSVVVTAGHLGRLRNDGTPTIEAANPSDWFAWMDGRFVFANTTLRDAVQEIERARNVEIRLLPPVIGDRRFTTSFGDEQTATILEVIGTGLGLDVQRTGSRSFTLRPK